MKNKLSSKPRIIVKMETGAIHWVAGNIDADVIFFDEDVEGLDEDRVSELDGNEVYLMHRVVDTDISDLTIEKVFKMAKSKDEELGVNRDIG